MLRTLAKYVIFPLGCVLVLHGTVWTERLRNESRYAEKNWEGVPGDIVFECLLGLVISAIGIIYWRQYKPIDARDMKDKQTLDELRAESNASLKTAAALQQQQQQSKSRQQLNDDNNNTDAGAGASMTTREQQRLSTSAANTNKRRTADADDSVVSQQ